MASKIRIEIGNLAGELVSNNDAAVQNTLLNFASAIGIDDGATPQAKLDGILAYLAEYMVNAGREKYFQKASAELREESIANVHW
jgi:hypothetical protein